MCRIIDPLFPRTGIRSRFYRTRSRASISRRRSQPTRPSFSRRTVGRRVLSWRIIACLFGGIRVSCSQTRLRRQQLGQQPPRLLLRLSVRSPPLPGDHLPSVLPFVFAVDSSFVVFGAFSFVLFCRFLSPAGKPFTCLRFFSSLFRYLAFGVPSFFVIVFTLLKRRFRDDVTDFRQVHDGERFCRSNSRLRREN